MAKPRQARSTQAAEGSLRAATRSAVLGEILSRGCGWWLHALGNVRLDFRPETLQACFDFLLDAWQFSSRQ